LLYKTHTHHGVCFIFADIRHTAEYVIQLNTVERNRALRTLFKNYGYLPARTCVSFS